jgi:hypothetical protein
MSNQPIAVEAEFTLLSKHLKGVQLRKAVRYRCALATLCYVTFAEGGPRHEAWAGNLSETGIGFYLDRSLDVDTVVGLRLNGIGKTTIKVEARVIHSTLQADGNWCIGCVFKERLQPEILDDVL